MAAAMPKRATVSQPGASQVSATLDSGTVVPQASPAVVSAAIARWFALMRPCSPLTGTETGSPGVMRNNILEYGCGT
jgi:hypothetical protein